ncbi:symporter [Desulfovibrio sp. SGI.169]|uniref:symporter n=1 Tax=Desulfovibrio sp. SGI.169 TaxID=3420561 RepID=UPI003D05B374
MQLRDLIMVFASFASMAAGVFLPGLAEPLEAMPRLMLMVMLYLSFLAVGAGALWRELRAMSGVVCRLTLLRLFALPVLAFAVFRLIMPEFSLGALLLGAAPVGVMAAVFSLMLGANTALILAGSIITSLLLPLSLPLLLSCMDGALRAVGAGGLNLPENFSLGGMTVSLCITILLPFAAAVLTRNLPRLSAGILRRQFPLLTTAIVISNLGIFSNYAEVLRQSPSLILSALLAACLLCVVMTAATLPATRGLPRQVRLAFLISFGVINNILLMIVSNEFFTVNEALMGAAYLAPLYILLFYYRYFSRTPSPAR